MASKHAKKKKLQTGLVKVKVYKLLQFLVKKSTTSVFSHKEIRSSQLELFPFGVLPKQGCLIEKLRGYTISEIVYLFITKIVIYISEM